VSACSIFAKHNLESKHIMTKDMILADIAIGVIATLFIVLGLHYDGLIGKFAMLWSGMLFGYICTTYLNYSEE
jgi:hypothetical protein